MRSLWTQYYLIGPRKSVDGAETSQNKTQHVCAVTISVCEHQHDTVDQSF